MAANPKLPQITAPAKRVLGQHQVKPPRTSNSVVRAGGYAKAPGSNDIVGEGTLRTPYTLAPHLLDGNTKPSGKRPTNGIVPNSPVGSNGTFDDMQNPAPGVDFGKFNTVAAKAMANLSGKNSSKTLTENDTAGPQKDFRPGDTAKNRALAVTNPYNLAKSYGKKGAHGKRSTTHG